MSVDVKGIIEWLEGWFYQKATVDNYLNNKADKSALTTTNNNLNSLQSTVDGKAPKNHASADNTYGVGSKTQYGHVKVDESLDTSSVNTVQNKVVSSALNNKVDKVTGKGLSTEDYTSAEKSKLANIEAEANKYVHPSTHNSNMIVNTTALNNIGTDANATQSEINTLIDLAIGDMGSIQAVRVVHSLPTASADTMGALYIVSEDSKVNVYYTEQGETSSSFSWHKMDTDILDELDLDWSNIENNPFSNKQPSDFANATHNHTKSQITDFTHTHGNLTNDGKLTTAISSTNKVVVTDTQNNIGVVEVDELNCGTFTELQSLIDNTDPFNPFIILDKDYKNNGSETELTINGLVAIIGNGHIIDADKKSRIFNVTGGTLTIVDTCLINGYLASNQPNGGGAIRTDVEGYCNIFRCTFIGNYAVRGSCICLNSEASRNSIKECDFQLGYSYESSQRGIAVYSYNGDVTIYNCVSSLEDNKSYYGATNKPYLTDHQSLTNYYTKSDIDDLFDDKQDVGDCITSIELVPKTEDSTGAIRLYYGDEE